MAKLIASIVVGAEPELVVKCVESLLASAETHEVQVRIIVNQAGLGAADRALELASRYQNVNVHINDVPAGFATNHNRALSNPAADFLLVANDDLVFHRDAASRCIDVLEQSEFADVASLSPRLLNEDGSLQRSTYGFPTVTRALLDLSGLRAVIPHNAVTDRMARWFGRDAGRSRFWLHDSTRDVETFRGAAMFVRVSAWNEIGCFNETARVGGEIADWHQRAANKGWRAVFFPGAEVTHLASRTVGKDSLLKSEYLKGYLSFFGRNRKPSALKLFRLAGLAVSSVHFAIASARNDRLAAQRWRTNISLLRLDPATWM